MEEAYPDAQIDALVMLLHALQEELPSLRHIAGHDDLDTAMVPASDDPQILVPRTRDPGPMFPWQRVLAEVALERLARATQSKMPEVPRGSGFGRAPLPPRA